MLPEVREFGSSDSPAPGTHLPILLPRSSVRKSALVKASSQEVDATELTQPFTQSQRGQL